jgi:hypothetical protein
VIIFGTGLGLDLHGSARLGQLISGVITIPGLVLAWNRLGTRPALNKGKLDLLSGFKQLGRTISCLYADFSSRLHAFSYNYTREKEERGEEERKDSLRGTFFNTA